MDIDESFRDDMIYIDIGFGCNGSTLPVFQDSIISENIRSLNLKQRQVFEVIHKWSRDYVTNFSSKVMKKVKPFHIFLTGGGGVGKSHLIKTIYMSINKVLMYKGGNPEKPRILLLAPTGVAAVNIDGTTIHTALAINVGGKLYPLNDRQRGILRNKLTEAKFIIIDEISMVSNVLLHQVHQRLNEIYGCSAELPFAGLPVLACGDLYQLPPVKGTPIYCNTGNIKGYLSLDLWRGFKMAELTEVMRQQGDYNFISLLNKIRISVVDNEVERSLLSRFVAKDNSSYPRHAVHMFAENCPAVDHNDLMLNEMEGQTISINAIDDIPPEVQLSDKQIDEIGARKISETGNLVSILNIKVGAQVMLTSNINIEDRLVNGLVGKVMSIAHEHGTVKIIYVKFNDKNAGLVTMRCDIVAQQQHWVPIQKYEASFPIKKNKPHPSIKRTQFPLVLSWACTIHKVQGLTLKEGIVSFELQRQKNFSQGQMYVA